MPKLLWAVLALVVAGCSSGGADTTSVPPETIPDTSAVGPGDGGVYDSSYQDAILEDGVVTYSEYRRAKLDVVSCMREQGYDAFLDESAAPIVLTVGYGVSAVVEESGLADSAYLECEGHYLNRVEAAYSANIDADQFWPAVFAAGLECAAEMGYEIGDIEGVNEGEIISRFGELEMAYPEVGVCFEIGKDRVLEEWETRIP
jgi:hypothetical protein